MIAHKLESRENYSSFLNYLDMDANDKLRDLTFFKKLSSFSHLTIIQVWIQFGAKYLLLSLMEIYIQDYSSKSK